MHRQTKPLVLSRGSTSRSYHKGWTASRSSTATSSPASPLRNLHRASSPAPGHEYFDLTSPGLGTITSSTPPLSSPSTVLPALPGISPIDSPLTTFSAARNVSSPDIRSFLAPRSSIGRATPMMGSPDSTHLPYLPEDPLVEMKNVKSRLLSPIADFSHSESSPSPPDSDGSSKPPRPRSSLSTRSKRSRLHAQRSEIGPGSAAASTSSSSRAVYEHYAQSGSTSPPPLPSRPASAPLTHFSLPSPSFQLSPYRSIRRSPSPRRYQSPPAPTIIEIFPPREHKTVTVVSVSPSTVPEVLPSEKTGESDLSFSPSFIQSVSPPTQAHSESVQSVSPANLPLPSSSSVSSESVSSVKDSTASSTRRRQVPSLRVDIPQTRSHHSEVPPPEVPLLNGMHIAGSHIKTASVLGLNHALPEEKLPLLPSHSNSAKTFGGLMQCMESLIDTGLPLIRDPPEVVVIGAAGSGKTTLVGGLLGLELPDEPTLCPIMYTLTRTPGRWTCQLTLIRHRDPLSATFENVEGEPVGPPLLDPVELPHALRSAVSQLVPAGATFTRDVICVNINAPNVADLCIFDLPGMTGGDRDARTLAKLCSQSPRTLILLAISCEGEVETFSALRLARENDPSGERTIGVLTKADRMVSPTPWAKILRGEEHPLLNGWFCPKQPTNVEQALSTEEQQRLGCNALSFKVDEVLTHITRERIRELRTLSAERLEVIAEELATIPVSPKGDPSSEIFKLLLNFSGDITRLMAGSATVTADNAFWSCIRAEQQAFRHEILQAAPKFVPWARNSVIRDLNWVEDPDSVEHIEFAMRNGEEIYLDDVSNQMAGSLYFNGKCGCSFQQKVIKDSTSTWAQSSYRFLHAIEQHVERELRERVCKHFARYQHGGLDGQVYSLALAQMRECRRRAASQLDDLVKSASVPVMLGSVAYDHYKRVFLEHYREAYMCSQGHADTVALLRGGAGAEAIDALHRLGIQNVSPAELLRLIPCDPFDSALNSMATSRAYYHVAQQCFLDTAVQTLISAFLVPLSQGLGASLVDGLQVGSHEHAARLVEQDPVARARRSELEKKQQHLQHGADLLARLSMTS